MESFSKYSILILRWLNEPMQKNSFHLRTQNYYARTQKSLRVHVKLLRAHMEILTCARETSTRTHEVITLHVKLLRPHVEFFSAWPHSASVRYDPTSNVNVNKFQTLMLLFLGHLFKTPQKLNSRYRKFHFMTFKWIQLSLNAVILLAPQHR